MLEIDGSKGEGGGQILRTSLALSCIFKRPFRIFSIRKGRSRPGLMPQHLACLRALAAISGATVEGDFQGSTEIFFDPSEPKAGDYSFDIGTAGSISLLLQAVVPPLITAKSISSITLRGGTHVPFSPVFDYISEVFIPTLNNMGVSIQPSINNYGFYPGGGGEAAVRVFPSGGPRGRTFCERGKDLKITGVSGVSNLPLSIAERQRRAALQSLSAHGLDAEIRLLDVSSFGHGTFFFIKVETGDCIAGFSALGERGKRAEAVGEEAARDLLDYYYSGACLDHHLSDQISLYLALAKEESSFTTSLITGHLLTNLHVLREFTGKDFLVEGEKGKRGRVVICP